MTLRHLEIFKAVAETGNFTKAAEQLFITQSAVSHAIRDLEEESGTRLFDRLSKRIQLTTCGLLLLEEIKPILASCDALEQKISHLEQEAPLHIVSCITVATVWLPAILKEFEKKYPQICVKTEVMSAAAAIQMLKDKKADLALIEGTKPQGPFLCIPFISYHLRVLCAPYYPIKTTKMNIPQLCEERLLLREKGSAVREVFDSTAFLHGCEVHPIWTSVSSQALKEAAKAGLGITILPDILSQDCLDDGSLKEIEVKELDLQNEGMVLLHKDKYLTDPLKELIHLISSKGSFISF